MKEYTLDRLKTGLERGTFTSVDLVRMYEKQIERLDRRGPKLNAVACLNPNAFKDADRLDRERRMGKIRGPLHGIPVLLKDNICSAGDGMPTTASSFALSDFFAPEDAHVVKRLRRAGMIIVGKANLSEWAYFMSLEKMPSGYGSLNGQVKHPYDEKIDPLGSSTGSAVAVAANLIPIAVGTETNGSLTAPAKQNLIATIKPTLGLVSRTGIIPITALQDTAGPLGRTVKDCALLLEAMAGTDPRDAATSAATHRKERYSDACGQPIRGMRIGLVSFTDNPDDDIEQDILADAKTVFEAAGAIVVTLSTTTGSLNNYQTMTCEFKHFLNRFFDSVRGHCPMASLSDVIAFNLAHADRCLRYGQSILVESERHADDLSDPEYLGHRAELLKEASRFQTLIREHRLDVIACAKRTQYAPITGAPCISLPARPLEGLVPRSLNLVGKPWRESDLIRVAHHYEKSAKRRVPPRF